MTRFRSLNAKIRLRREISLVSSLVIKISGNNYTMKPISFCPFIAAALITCGCTTLKRYDSLQAGGTDNNLADIDLFGYSLSKAGSVTGAKTLWDLSADAQSQFIKILHARYPDNEKFINAMSNEYLKPDN